MFFGDFGAEELIIKHESQGHEPTPSVIRVVGVAPCLMQTHVEEGSRFRQFLYAEQDQIRFSSPSKRFSCRPRLWAVAALMPCIARGR